MADHENIGASAAVAHGMQRDKLQSQQALATREEVRAYKW